MSNTLLCTVRVVLKRLADALRRPGAPDGGDARPAPKVAAPEQPSLSVSLSVSGQDEPIVMSLTPGQQIILGRADESVDTELLVDMTPYNAHELGVSRKHAAIEYRGHKWNYPDVWLMDMGSANGTYRNGQRLIPHAPHPLRDGDDIRLGHLVVRVHVHRVYYVPLFLFLVRIRLHSLSSNTVWETNGSTWDAALQLALLYGWQPALDVRLLQREAHVVLSLEALLDRLNLDVSAPYHREAHVTQADARVLADALERALPDLADEPPNNVVLHLTPPVGPPLLYFGGQAGKQKVCDLIAFCRQGAFRIEAS